MKFFLTPLLFLSVFCFYSTAQDIHLSQFYASDLLLNPAKTGDFDGDYRFTGNYRDQWSQINQGPLTTFLVSFDKAFHYYSHEISGGIFLARDQFSGFNTVTTKALFSLAYSYVLKGNKLRFGIQSGLVSNSTDLSKQTFPDQWDYYDGNFNTGISNQETNLYRSQNYGDFNIGAQWSKRFGKIEAKAGGALDHINRPKDSYFSVVTERLEVQKVVNGEVNYYLNNKITIQPKVLWMFTTKDNDLVLGGNVKYNTGNKIIPNVFAGSYFRSGVSRNVDAFIPVVGFGYKRFNLGFSYDVNVSTLSQGVQRAGTFEFSLIYIAASSKSKYIALPCDRY